MFVRKNFEPLSNPSNNAETIYLQVAVCKGKPIFHFDFAYVTHHILQQSQVLSFHLGALTYAR